MERVGMPIDVPAWQRLIDEADRERAEKKRELDALFREVISFELFGADQRACTGAAGCSSGYYDMYNIVSPSIDNSPSEGAHGAPRFATETRPRNMSVVWVMRIK
jgi:hypothetical protein